MLFGISPVAAARKYVSALSKLDFPDALAPTTTLRALGLHVSSFKDLYPCTVNSSIDMDSLYS